MKLKSAAWHPNKFTKRERTWLCHQNGTIDEVLQIAEVFWRAYYNGDLWNELSESEYDELTERANTIVKTILRERARKRGGTEFIMAMSRVGKG